MVELHHFLEQHFALVFALNAAWVFLCFALCQLWHWKRGIKFPPLDSVRPLFHEGMASGCSYRSWWTRLGGANNCLRVTVTDREVWVRPFFPFSALAPIYDLEHCILRASIVGIEESRSALSRFVLLAYRTDSGSIRRIRLRLRNPDGFLAALKPPPLP